MNLSPKEILKKYWGYDHFRPLQEEIILSVLEKNDTLALLPTGGGKSICFQVPALLMQGVCIVVSPLIALMKDQVCHLKNKGIKAEAIFAGMHHSEIQSVLSKVAFGDNKFLYISPERLATESFRTVLKSMKVCLLAVDEAHCISQWGYDFRPDYLSISEVREFMPDVPVLALTATATPEVAKDIMQQLNFKQRRIYVKSFIRPNLSYVVRHASNKPAQLLKIFKGVPGSSVVYANSRRATVEYAMFLQKSGIRADFYHAGLTTNERDRKQEQWMKGNIRVMVCTNAFGMGIDKPDVRTVVHLEPPASLEAYFQEAGRAGRDGKKAYAVLLYSLNDKNALQKIKEDFPSKEDLQNTYESLCEFFRIPIDQKPEESFPFNIVEFCNYARKPPRVISSHIKLLEQSKIIAVNEYTMSAPLIKCLASVKQLNDFYSAYPSFAPLCKMILRTCEGVFFDYVPIAEQAIRSRLNMSTNEWNTKLQALDEWNIFSYRPVSTYPEISFLHPRVSKNHLLLDTDFLTLLRNQHVKRISGMLQYLNNNEVCRSRVLVNYFGERFSEACGVCDVCIDARKKGGKHRNYSQLIIAIEKELHQPRSLETISKAVSANPEDVTKALQWLADAEMVRINEEGLFVKC
ncbi:MAG: ATP-dependent DNA helicase RecQ [Chitinophagales bacterium]|nr:ATP-dependent DNA helicase RecQ [Chitinophagales bacterium]